MTQRPTVTADAPTVHTTGIRYRFRASSSRLTNRGLQLPPRPPRPRTAEARKTAMQRPTNRARIRKAAAPPASTRIVQPLEEVHFDLFFVCGEIVLIFIDRASRYEWIYFLDKKSDLPRILQQFLIDANSAHFTVGSLNCALSSAKEKGIDAEVLNQHLSSHHLTQRVKPAPERSLRECGMESPWPRATRHGHLQSLQRFSSCLPPPQCRTPRMHTSRTIELEVTLPNPPSPPRTPF